ncbi:MAG: hypothetical protein IJM17_07110, partial [Firmicutes bacterium]|nr:hypothetical protein [Bacillota bacterium]
DSEKLKSLMALYRKFYTAIGIIILVLGVALTPFLSFLIKDIPKDMPRIGLYYVLYVLNAAASYFFTYKRSLIICDQKEYISTLEHLAVSAACILVRLLILVKTRDYSAYLFTSIVFTVIGNFLISHIADRMYPLLKEKDVKPLPKEEVATIRADVSGMFCHKLGGVIVFSSDNLIISKFVGLVSVGLYSNYTLLTGGISNLIYKIFGSATASIGNLIAAGDKEHTREVMDHIILVNVWMFGFTGICLFCLIPPFIRLWLGEEFLLSTFVLICLIVSYYLTGIRKTVLVFKEAAGIFRADMYKALIEAAANVILSIPLAIKLGTAGVILGTILTTAFICIWFEPYVFYNNYFGGGWRKYLLNQLGYAVLNTLLCALTWFLCSLVSFGGYGGFILQMLICASVPNAVYFILFGKSAHFAYFLGIAKKMLKRR